MVPNNSAPTAAPPVIQAAVRRVLRRSAGGVELATTTPAAVVVGPACGTKGGGASDGSPADGGAIGTTGPEGDGGLQRVGALFLLAARERHAVGRRREARRGHLHVDAPLEQPQGRAQRQLTGAVAVHPDLGSGR
jgi:hypothetical protein